MYQKRVSLQVIISPCKEHDLFQARPERLYERKTTPSRVTVEKLYANIATLFNRNHYRQELIFNMDESWVAHQDKTFSIRLYSHLVAIPTRNALQPVSISLLLDVSPLMDRLLTSSP